jgi:hypothetical protein
VSSEHDVGKLVGPESQSSIVIASTLEVDNAKLKQCVKSLTRRIAELESQLKEKDNQLQNALQRLSTYNDMVPVMLAAASTAPGFSSKGPTDLTKHAGDDSVSSISTTESALMNTASNAVVVSQTENLATTSCVLQPAMVGHSVGMHVHRNDSVSSISDTETASDSSVVVVSSGLHHNNAATAYLSTKVGTHLEAVPAKKAKGLSTVAVLSLDESDDDDGGWS